MIDEQRFAEIEQQLKALKPKQKDVWDKLAIASSMLIPLAIGAVGGTYSYLSQRANTQIAKIQTIAESKLKQAELVSKFFEPLTGPDAYKRAVAVESLLVAAPDYGPVLVRIAAEPKLIQDDASYATTALDNRRETLIRLMFGVDASSRIDAYTQLLQSWSSDESLIDELIKYSMRNKENKDGIFNTMTLLNYMNLDTIKAKKTEVISFANSVKGNGPKTKKLIEKLHERLAN